MRKTHTDIDIVYLVLITEEYKDREGITGQQAFETLTNLGAYEYMLNFYDIIHTLGTEGIVDELYDFIQRSKK